MIIRRNIPSKTSGIYIIQSSINGNIYIGSASDFNSRKHEHFNRLKENRHNNKIQSHYDLYGKSDLKFGIIEFVTRPINTTKKEFRMILLAREQYWLDTLNPEFNICKKAGSCYGVERTEEFKQKHRGENSVSKRPEVKEKQIQAKKDYWNIHPHPIKEKNPFYNKHHTLKTCQIIGSKNSIKMKGNQYALGNTFTHTPTELEKMHNWWTPERRKERGIQAKQNYDAGMGFAKINNKPKQRNDRT
jgi:group I intron endonuclease